MKNTVFPHKFWRPFLDCTPQLFFRPQYVWCPVHLKGHLIPLCYETLVVNWQNWLFTLFHQSRSVLSPNPIHCELSGFCYRGMLVSVGQSHDISLWITLSLGNRSINVEMIYKLRVFDINWYLITLIIYEQTLKWLLGELTRGYDTPV